LNFRAACTITHRMDEPAALRWWKNTKGWSVVGLGAIRAASRLREGAACLLKCATMRAAFSRWLGAGMTNTALAATSHNGLARHVAGMFPSEVCAVRQALSSMPPAVSFFFCPAARGCSETLPQLVQDVGMSLGTRYLARL